MPKMPAHSPISRTLRSRPGLRPRSIDIEDIGWRDGGGFVDLDNRDIELVFKLYPWEWMFHDAFGAQLCKPPTRWIEPPWKTVLSNKGILPLLWEMFPDHPNLLPAFFEDDPERRAARHLASCASRSIHVKAPMSPGQRGQPLDQQDGPYGGEGFVRQALAPLPNFGDHIR